MLNEFLEHVYLHYLLWSYLLKSIDKIADAFEYSNSFYPIVISMLMLNWVNMECTQTAYKTQIKNLYVNKKRTNLQILDNKNICVNPPPPHRTNIWTLHKRYTNWNSDLLFIILIQSSGKRRWKFHLEICAWPGCINGRFMSAKKHWRRDDRREEVDTSCHLLHNLEHHHLKQYSLIVPRNSRCSLILLHNLEHLHYMTRILWIIDIIYHNSCLLQWGQLYLAFSFTWVLW